MNELTKDELIEQNKYLQESVDLLNCDNACQKRLRAENKLKTYRKTQDQNIVIIDELDENASGYYKVVDELESDMETRETTLNEIGEQVATEYQNVFNSLSQNTGSLLGIYNNSESNYDNTLTLDDILTNQNDKIDNNILNAKSDVATNNRKSYYENQELEYLQKWNTFYFYVLLVILITYFVSIWLVTTNVDFKMTIGIFIVLIVWYFFGKGFLIDGIRWVRTIISWFPKNIYLNL